MFRQVQEQSSAAGGAGGSTSMEALRRADAAWLKMRTRKVRLPPNMRLNVFTTV
jgi:hypothetical protein